MKRWATVFFANHTGPHLCCCEPMRTMSSASSVPAATATSSSALSSVSSSSAAVTGAPWELTGDDRLPWSMLVNRWSSYCGAHRRQPGRDTYIGFTNHVKKREGTHNDLTDDGKKKYGAKRTAKMGGEFELAFFVVGFATARDARKFEWQWQRTNSTRRCKMVRPKGHKTLKGQKTSAKKVKKFYYPQHGKRSIEARWNDLCDMLARPPPFASSIDWRTYQERHPLLLVRVEHTDADAKDLTTRVQNVARLRPPNVRWIQVIQVCL